MNLKMEQFVEQESPPISLEEMRLEFEQYDNTGLVMEVVGDLVKKFENNELYPYKKTLDKIAEPEIVVESNDEQLFTDTELGEFVDTHFEGNILRKALVSSIKIRLNDVYYQSQEDNFLGLPAGRYYYIPKEVFVKYLGQLSLEQKKHFEEYIYRAESYSIWNSITTNELLQITLVDPGNVLPTPVVIYNQEFDKENKGIKDNKLKEVGLEYLSLTPQVERSKLYALGSLAHEIAHNIFEHLIKKMPHKKEWEEIVDQLGDITAYAKEYDKGGGKDYEENFCEAVRLFTTAREWLDKNGYSQVVNYIEKYFPEIKS